MNHEPLTLPRGQGSRLTPVSCCRRHRNETWTGVGLTCLRSRTFRVLMSNLGCYLLGTSRTSEREIWLRKIDCLHNQSATAAHIPGSRAKNECLPARSRIHRPSTSILSRARQYSHGKLSDLTTLVGAQPKLQSTSRSVFDKLLHCAVPGPRG